MKQLEKCTTDFNKSTRYASTGWDARFRGSASNIREINGYLQVSNRPFNPFFFQAGVNCRGSIDYYYYPLLTDQIVSYYKKSLL